jgi:iron complex outermembrane recepter protein
LKAIVNSVAWRQVRVYAWACFATSLMAASSDTPKKHFDLPADTAEQSLRRFSAQSGVELLYSTEVAAGVRTNAVRGEFLPHEAVERLLTGTGLSAVRDA